MARLPHRTPLPAALGVSLALCFLSLSASSAHDDGVIVRLVQPSARLTERDFHVSRNAEAPCPTNKQASDPKNYAKAGKDLEFVWFNPSAVQGGFRLELLNTNHELISTLVDSPKPAAFDTNGLSKTRVPLPNGECKDCILRLVQTTADGKTQLLSCADTDVLDVLPESVKKCEGDDCTVECGRDEQCGTGSCVNGSCYCLEGYYGASCLKESRLSPRQLDLAEFALKSANGTHSKNKMYWRIVKDELEMVLKFPTNTWTVFGFRPHDAADKCPWLDESFARKQKGDPSSDNSLDDFHLDIKNISESIGRGCGDNEVFSKCPEYSRECEASCDWTSFPESIPSCPRACGSPRCVCKEGYVRAGNNRHECVPFKVCQEEVAVECPQNETWAKCGVACEPSCSSMYDTTPCSHKCTKPACTCADNFVRFNGECIFWSNCPNLEQRVLTPQESAEQLSSTPASSTEVTSETPTSTSFAPTTEEASLFTGEAFHCGANETVNECGRVCETDCNTLFLRGECSECGKPACACQQGFARDNGECIYWGDCPFNASGLPTVAPASTIRQLLDQTRPTTPTEPKTVAVTTSPATTSEPIVQSTYAPKSSENEHGEVVGDVCFGEWRWPRNCKADCDYRLSWNYAESSDEIEFSLETKVSANWWSGVGFSKSGSMQDADFIVVKNHGGILSLHDMNSDGHEVPHEDESNDVFTPTVIGHHVNGVLRAQFTRKRNTGDNSSDVTFTNSDCFHFLFPVTGGRLDAQGNIQRHLATPKVSSEPVCVRSCQVEASNEVEAEPTCNNEFRFPDNCRDDECEYVARWDLNQSTEEVRFQIKSRGIGRWTGIGFSKDGAMTNSDIVTGWVYNGKAYVTDRFAYGRQLPAIDPAGQQNLEDIEGKIEDDYQVITFSRKVRTSDTKTDLPLDQCYYFLFPIGGGRVIARKGSDFQYAKTPIGYHDLNQPKVSKTKICICDEHQVPLGAVPNRVRTRRQVKDPFTEKLEEPFAGLPDMARLGQISIKELTGKASYDVKMDPFACSDVTVMKVLDGAKARVVDAFAQSKYGLEPDEFFGGSQSYAEISASEENGQATVFIRRPLKASDVGDHAISEGRTQLFWANGPPGDAPVRLSGATHVETLLMDFFGNPEVITHETETSTASTTVEIADLEDAAETTTFEPSSTTEDAEPFELHTEMPLDMVPPEVFRASTADYRTTQIPTTMEDEKVESTTTAKIDDETTESNFIDEPDSGEHEVATPEAPVGTVTRPVFTAEVAACHGGFVHPPNCTTQCDYAVSWQTDGANAHFQLWAKMQPERYSGIGFSTEGGMMNADVIIASVLKDGSVTVTDQWSPGYGRPSVDENQDVFAVATRYSDGELAANFSRSLATTDAGNDLDLGECQFFLFLHAGGALEGGSAELRKHFETPISSGSRICLGRCGAKEEATTAAPTIELEAVTKKQRPQGNEVVKTAGGSNGGPLVVPALKPRTHFTYDAVLKFPKVAYDSNLDAMDSLEAQHLATQIKEALGIKLREKFPQMEKIDVVKFAKGVQSLVRLDFEGANSPNVKEVHDYLKELATAGSVGSLEVDPKTVMLKEHKHKTESDDDVQVKLLHNYLLIAVAVLVVLTILAALCCVTCRRRSRRQTYPTEPMSFTPPMHKPYMAAYISEPIYDAKSAAKRSPPLSGVSPGSQASPQPKHHPEETPKGMGETTYQEWYTKVASRDAPTHHQESTMSVAASRPHSRMSTVSGAPYISYPHESGYYTLGGEHRMPPPSYYRQF